MQQPIESAPPFDQREKRKRRRELIAISFLVLVFVGLGIFEFRLTRMSTTLPFVNSIFFFGLLNLNLIILIALFWLIFRNLGKVFLERRRQVLGARLKTKLIIAFVSFSVIPTLLLFLISALYINTSFDKWFSLKIQNTLQASLEITRTYYKNTDENAMHFAEHISSGLSKAFVDRSPGPWIQARLEEQRDLLSLDAVEFYADPLEPRVLSQRTERAPLSYYPILPLDLLDKAFGGERVSTIQHIGSGDLIRTLVPVKAGLKPTIRGVVAVSVYIPVSLVNKVDEIASVVDDYRDTNPLKYPVKTAYLVILVMITLVILFVAIWVGLYLARELTVPVERLVFAARQVGAGNLDLSIRSEGSDELAVLVESFNKMTQDLRQNRQELTRTGLDLEQRRLQLEAVLANVSTGVLSVDSDGKIAIFNAALGRLLGVDPVAALGRPASEILTDTHAPLAALVQRTLGLLSNVSSTTATAPSAETEQWNVRKGNEGDSGVLAAVATPIRHYGVVVGVDDMTHLIKGQRELAWREVARRIAHEIKNPLTPIKLSAQRLQRQLGHSKGKEGQLLKECTDTIIQHADDLKEMVNEFSNFARFPEISPAPHQLNDAIRDVLSLYQQAHSEIQFQVGLEPKLPIFEFDQDQIKRVMINLIENAVAALRVTTQSIKKVSVATHYNEGLQMAVIEVSDNGPGMPEEVKARVFEPYFSTKAEGTGLGLAIAKRIVNDHDGFIRVQSAPGEGSRFWIELPTALRQVSTLRV